MKKDRLAALIPRVLEAVEKIEDELEQKGGSKKSRRKKQFAAQQTQNRQNQQIRQFAQEARRACQHWIDESKTILPKDVGPVVEFFLIAIAHVIAQKIISETFFKREKALLDLIDDIVACCDDQADLVYIRLRSKYYRTLMYITQQGNEVATIVSCLKEIVAFDCDQLNHRCKQIHLLNTLCVGCVTWMRGAEREPGVQDTLSAVAHQMMHKMMDVYTSLPSSSLCLPHWDRVSVYSNIVMHAVDLALYHCIEITRDPKKESLYRNRVENLMSRLHTFLDSYRQLIPHEKDCLSTLSRIVDFLKIPGFKNHWLRTPLLKIAENFAPYSTGSQVLAYRVAIATFRKPTVENQLRVVDDKSTIMVEIEKITSTLPDTVDSREKRQAPPPVEEKKTTDLLREQNETLQQQLRETEQVTKNQHKALIRKNKRLTQQMKKWEKEKTEFDQSLKTKKAETKVLTNQNAQLKTQLAEIKQQKVELEQARAALAAELSQVTAEREQQKIERQQRESTWGERLRERQTAFHSVSAENRRLRVQITDSQSTVKELDKALKQTAAQLVQITRQASDSACDNTAVSKKIQALQQEIGRLRALLSAQTPASRQGPGFSFS